MIKRIMVVGLLAVIPMTAQAQQEAYWHQNLPANDDCVLDSQITPEVMSQYISLHGFLPVVTKNKDAIVVSYTQDGLPAADYLIVQDYFYFSKDACEKGIAESTAEGKKEFGSFDPNAPIPEYATTFSEDTFEQWLGYPVGPRN